MTVTTMAALPAALLLLLTLIDNGSTVKSPGPSRLRYKNETTGALEYCHLCTRQEFGKVSKFREDCFLQNRDWKYNVNGVDYRPWCRAGVGLVPSCPEPKQPEKGRVDCRETGTRVYGECQVRCSKYYQPQTPNITCQQEDLKWSAEPACFISECPPLGVPAPGNITCESEGPSKIGDQCNATCPEGFHPTIPKVTCQACGTWSATPRCEKDILPITGGPTGEEGKVLLSVVLVFGVLAVVGILVFLYIYRQRKQRRKYSVARAELALGSDISIRSSGAQTVGSTFSGNELPAVTATRPAVRLSWSNISALFRNFFQGDWLKAEEGQQRSDAEAAEGETIEMLPLGQGFAGAVENNQEVEQEEVDGDSDRSPEESPLLPPGAGSTGQEDAAQGEGTQKQMLAETREKITFYQAKVNAESDYKMRIENLEAAVQEFSRQKETAMEEFSRFKKVAEEREQALKVGHSERMVELSQEVLQAKKEFEEHLSRFREWRQNLEKDKTQSISTMKEEHERELETVRSKQRRQNDDWLNECAKIEDKYKGEVDRLRGELDTVNEERLKLETDFELKFAKQQAFFEKEMEVLRNSQSVAKDTQLKNLEEQFEKLKKDARVQEAQLRKQVEDLLGRLSASEDEVEKGKMEMGKLIASLKDRTSSSDALFAQLEELKRDLKARDTQIADTERALTAHKEKCTAQQEELLKKSTQIGELEATKLQQSGTIADLQSELAKLRDRLTWLESERKALENQRQDLTEQQSTHLKSLEKSLEDLSKEKQALQQKLEQELAELRMTHEQELRQLREEHKLALSRLSSDSGAQMEQARLEARTQMEQTMQTLKKDYEAKVAQLTGEKEKLMAEFENVKSDLMTKLSSAEEEVARLAKTVRESESGLGAASGHINSLKEASNRLKVELDKAREELKAAKLSNASLQAELDKLKLLHNSKSSEHQQELKQRLDQLTKELDTKWTDTLRAECAKLRTELERQKEDEMRAALNQLSKLKDQELVADREGWQLRVQDLTKQVTELTRAASSRAYEWETERTKLQKEAEDERGRLMQDMHTAAQDYAKKVEFLEASHKDKIAKLLEQKEQELQERLEQAKKQHIEELSGQLAAHRATVDSVQQQHQQAQAQALESARAKHKQELDALREVLLEQHTQEVEKQRKSHQGELHAARIELERALEISRQKDQDHQMNVEELQGEISRREQHIQNLQEEIERLSDSIARLNKEIENKGKEILRIRSEATAQLKKVEQKLKQDHDHEMNNLNADHVHEVEGMIAEFKKAQELLKDKISLLQINLEEAEEKYQNRESRLEDLELIQQLRELVKEKEQRVQELVDEKRFFQLELVNRETNFNKVFNASPNVGVLNPLSLKKRKGDTKNMAKHTSAPSLAPHKLDPLPGSPLHDEKLNPSKPLPMPSFAKKFVQ